MLATSGTAAKTNVAQSTQRLGTCLESQRAVNSGMGYAKTATLARENRKNLDAASERVGQHAKGEHPARVVKGSLVALVCSSVALLRAWSVTAL